MPTLPPRARPAWVAALIALACSSSPIAASGRADEPIVVLRGDGAALAGVPVRVELGDDAAALGPGDYALAPEGGGPELTATVVDAGGSRMLGLVIDHLGADESRRFRARRLPPAPPGEGFRVTAGDDGEIRVERDGATVTTFHPGPAKPYLHPLVGPDGLAMTRAYPMADVAGEARDHPHQRSLWLTHGDVNGVDFWASDPLNGPSPKHGTIRQERVIAAAGGRALAVVRTANRWLDGAGRAVCSDERLFAFLDAGDARVVDVDATIRATDGPVTFGDTKEGSFGLRVASTLDVDRKLGGKIVNAEGLADAAAWGQPSAWVDYSGPVDGHAAGVAVLNHPSSFRHPTRWHVRTYGLFAANPFGDEAFGAGRSGAHTIAAGDALALRHRVLLHRGDAASARLPEQFAAYARPPRVTAQP